MSLLFAIALMILVVVPLVAWAVRKDRRGQLEAEGPPGTGTEEVA